MKKLFKFMGLLLVAGALFMGCQQEASISTDEITLSNGTWNIVYAQKCSYKDTTTNYDLAIKTTNDQTYKVANDLGTLLKGSYEYSMSITLPAEYSEAVISAAVDGYEETLEEGQSIKVNGRTIIISEKEVFTQEEIDEQNERGLIITKNMEDNWSGATITTNKNKTVYKVSYTKTGAYKGTYDVKYEYTFTKK